MAKQSGTAFISYTRQSGAACANAFISYWPAMGSVYGGTKLT